MLFCVFETPDQCCPILLPHQKGREIVNVNHVYIRNDTVARPHGHSTIFRCTQLLRTVGYYSALVSVGHRSNGTPKCIVVLLMLYVQIHPVSIILFPIIYILDYFVCDSWNGISILNTILKFIVIERFRIESIQKSCCCWSSSSSSTRIDNLFLLLLLHYDWEFVVALLLLLLLL